MAFEFVLIKYCGTGKTDEGDTFPRTETPVEGSVSKGLLLRKALNATNGLIEKAAVY